MEGAAGMLQTLFAGVVGGRRLFWDKAHHQDFMSGMGTIDTLLCPLLEIHGAVAIQLCEKLCNGSLHPPQGSLPSWLPKRIGKQPATVFRRRQIIELHQAKRRAQASPRPSITCGSLSGEECDLSSCTAHASATCSDGPEVGN